MKNSLNLDDTDKLPQMEGQEKQNCFTSVAVFYKGYKGMDMICSKLKAQSSKLKVQSSKFKVQGSRIMSKAVKTGRKAGRVLRIFNQGAYADERN